MFEVKLLISLSAQDLTDRHQNWIIEPPHHDKVDSYRGGRKQQTNKA